MEKKIIEAFKMAPAVVELDQPGYLDQQELAGLKVMQMHLRTKCQELALRYLRDHTSPVGAKNAAMADVDRVAAGTTPDDPDFDLRPYFEVVRKELSESIERESRKSELGRTLTRGVMAVPSLFRIAFIGLILVMLVFAARDLIFR